MGIALQYRLQVSHHTSLANRPTKDGWTSCLMCCTSVLGSDPGCWGSPSMMILYWPAYILCIRPGLTGILWVTSTLFHLTESGRIRPPGAACEDNKMTIPHMANLGYTAGIFEVYWYWYHYWLVVSTPLKNMSSSNWDDDIPNIWKNESSCSKPPSRLYHCTVYHCISPVIFGELSGTPPRSKEPSSPGLPNLCLVVSSANSPKLMKPQMGIWNCWAIWMGNTGGNDKFNGSSIKSFMDYQWDKHGQTNHISSPAAGSRVLEGSILVF